MGSSTVPGKAAPRAIWSAAVARYGSLQFTVDRVLRDPACRELAIICSSDIDGRTRRLAENLAFKEDGLVATAEVFHGVPDVT